ncbi:MAG: hypothetical protein QOD76_777, partial [Solirubrobacteraceae bacterium]|nr:hypothetical protein [Solirubrobacteraceae bacterium]
MALGQRHAWAGLRPVASRTGAAASFLPVSRRALPILVIGGYALFGLTWAMSLPPFAAPDEDAHYLRTLGVANGHLLGPRGRYLSDPALTPRHRAAINDIARVVEVPPGLSPVGFACIVHRTRVSAACQNRVVPPRVKVTAVTTVGGYQPLPYLLPATVIERADSAPAADRLARLAGLALWLALIAIATLLSWSAAAPAASLVGLVAAVTPMVVFVGAGLTGSGPEVAGSIAFAAAAMRLAREPEPSRWVWAAAAFSGAVLALSRSPGPLWVLAGLGLLVGLAGPRRLLALRRAAPAAAAVTSGVLLVSVVLNRLWESAYGPHIGFGLSPLWSSVGAGRRQLDEVMLQAIGRFGYLELGLPALAYVAWAGLVVALVLLAAVLGTRAERVLLGATVLLAVALPVLFYAAVLRNADIPLQGRHVLPLLVLVPLLAGEIVRRRRDALRAVSCRVLLAGFAVPAAAVQLVAWYVNAHRSAVGTDGPWWFLDRAEWSPPAGWGIWLALAVVAAVGLAATALLARRGR